MMSTEQEKIQDVIDTDWHFWHIRKRPLLLLYFFYSGPALYEGDLPAHISTSGSCVDHVITKNSELESLKIKQWEQLEADPEYILRFMDKIYELNKQHLNEWWEVIKRDFLPLSNEDLARAYNLYITQLLEYSSTIYLPLALEPVFSEKVRNILEKKYPEKVADYYNIVMTPVRESELIEERRSLLKIALRYPADKDGVVDSPELSEHIERFSYLKRKDMFMEFFSNEDYLRRLHEFIDPRKELKELDAEAEKKKTRFEQILELFRDDPFAQTLFRTTNESIFFRTWRTERYTQSTYYFISLFQTIASRIGVDDYHDILYLLPQEIIEFLLGNKEINNTLIQERKRALVYITFGHSDALLLHGDQAILLFNHLTFFENPTGEITGTPAYMGKVKGVVTVIAARENYSRIAGSEILVIHTTTPDILPFIKNVKAIVTEEGGILSHAAVISREFKIPCVIGTKIATKVLKDGDIVEVDAEKGIVKKL